MRILVTGACGFVGRYVIDELAATGHEPYAIDLNQPRNVDAAHSMKCNMTNGDDVARIVSELVPDACVHLAAIAFVPDGTAQPELMYNVNLMGTLNLLEAFRKHASHARFLFVSTAQVYGAGDGSDLIREDSPPMPSSPYASSKVSAELLTRMYGAKQGMDVMIARPHNHIGPGQQEKYVVPNFARQLKELAKGNAKPRIMVGNLESERDFTDVRDVARAYGLLLEKGRQGQSYNIASGRRISMRAILNELCQIIGVEPEVVVDQEKFRPSTNWAALDTSSIREDTGWQPDIELAVTLKDIVESI